METTNLDYTGIFTQKILYQPLIKKISYKIHAIIIIKKNYKNSTESNKIYFKIKSSTAYMIAH